MRPTQYLPVLLCALLIAGVVNSEMFEIMKRASTNFQKLHMKIFKGLRETICTLVEATKIFKKEGKKFCASTSVNRINNKDNNNDNNKKMKRPMEFDECGCNTPEPERHRCTKPLGKTFVGLQAPAPAFGFPWHVRLTIGPDVNNSICGGTIISSKAVLSAAHCVYNLTSDTELYVVTGDYRKGKEFYEATYKVARYDIYPFKRKLIFYDIMMLHLAKEIKFNYMVRKICLPPKQPELGEKVYIPGTGVVRAAVRYGLTNELQQVTTTILDPKEHCKNTFVMKNAILCAGLPFGNEFDTCKGDSGAGVVGQPTSRFLLYGIVSTRNGCGQGKYPAEYINVRFFMNWITKTVT